MRQLTVKSLINPLFFVFLLLLPLLPATVQFGYEQIKVVFFIFGTLILTALILLTNWKNLNFNNIQKVAAVFIGALFLSSIFGVNVEDSFLGIPPYFQGWVVYSLFFLFSIVVSNISLTKKQLFYSWIISSAIVSIFAIMQFIQITFLHQIIPTYAGRVVSTFGQPNFYSGFILLMLPFAINLLKEKKAEKILGIFAVSLGITAILISQSRVAILMMLLLFVYYLLQKVSGKLRVGVVIFGIAGVIGVLGGSYLTGLGLLGKEVREPFSNQWLVDNSPEKRIFIIDFSTNLILKKPLLGYGLENIPEAFRQYFYVTPKWEYKPYYFTLKDLLIDRMHNYPLDLLVYSGVLGMLGWLMLTILVGRKLYKTDVFLPFLIYIIWIQFQNQSIIHLIFYWLCVGIAAKNISR